MSQAIPTGTRWQAQSARRSAANRARLRQIEWRQLEQLVDAAGAWLPAGATVPAGWGLAATDAALGLRALRARGLAEYRSERSHAGRWKASDEGLRLVMEIRT